MHNKIGILTCLLYQAIAIGYKGFLSVGYEVELFDTKTSELTRITKKNIDNLIRSFEIILDHDIYSKS